MKIVRVIPLSKGIFKSELSYFTSSPISLGSLVTVPVRGTTVHALVIGIDDAQKEKAKIKSASYSIKKIEKVQETPFFHPAYIEAAQDAADYFATTPGAVVEATTPTAILDAYVQGDITASRVEITPSQTDIKNQPYIFQSDDKERLATFKSFIRESFARKESVFYCLPSALKIEHTYQQLEKGIAPYTFILHGQLSKKELVSTWSKILESKRPVLVIATPGYLSIPRQDIGAIILDLENSSGYKMSHRPFIDFRVFAEQYAKKAGIKIIFGDMFLRVETLEREKQKDLIPFAPIKYRLLEQAQQLIVDMQQKDAASSKKTFTIISDELHALCEHTKENNEHLFVLTTRRGLSPITVCGDCGTLVKCSSCSAPMTLHKRSGKHVFMCHKCGNRKTSEVTCEHCQSWKLTPLGIGTQSVEKELSEKHKDMKVFRLDSDAATTHSRARTIVQEYMNTPGSILVGTEMALGYLNGTIENIAVASVDSLFALPDFRGNERIFNLLLRLYTTATKNFVIQTRSPETPLFDYITKGNLLDFYRDEIAERKDLGYPPYKTFIKITREGNKESVQEDMRKLSKRLESYDALAFPAFIQEIKNKYRMHILIKLESSTWIDQELLGTIRSLPPSFSVNIDPENLM